MSYVMEYAKDIKPNEEVIEDKGVKVLIDPAAIIYLLGTEMDFKKKNFHLNLFLRIQTKQNVVAVGESFKVLTTIVHLKFYRMWSMLKFINLLKF